MRRTVVGIFVFVVALALASAAQADLVSKSYEFRGDLLLEIGATTQDGVRVDNVRFHMPPTVDGVTTRTAGLANATVTVSNTGKGSRKVALALALFDEQGRLVGVASVGSGMRSVRAGRQRSFTLIFDHVNSLIHRAKTFQISVETR
jgi:hypothetical protein